MGFFDVDALRARGDARSALARQSGAFDQLINPAGLQSGLGMRTVLPAHGIDETVEGIDQAESQGKPARGFGHMGGAAGSFQHPGSIADNPVWWMQGMNAPEDPSDILGMLPQSMQSLVKGKR